MEGKGLVKLMEECGELTQIAAKRLAVKQGDEHWDGKGSLKKRLEDEIADVIAAAAFVSAKLHLDGDVIEARAAKKLAKFHGWDKEVK